MILKPSNISPSNGVFSGSDAIEISWKNNGDIMTAFEVSVYDNSTDILIHTSSKLNSYIAKYTIPANTLANNKVYKYTIKVYNINNETTVSDYKIISCYSRPIVNIDTDGFVRNQIATFTSTYSQTQNITLKAYKYILYDEFDNVIEQSEYLYDGLLAYTFNYRLVDDTNYKIECIVICQNDLLGTSGKINFVADYIPPQVYFNLSAEAYVDKPYVRLLWTTVRIIGKVEGTANYIGDSKLDVTNGTVYFDDGFTLQNDFTIKMWVEGIQENEEILFIDAGLSHISLKYHNNKMHLYKTYVGVTNHIVSEEIGIITPSDMLYIGIQQQYGKISLISEVIL